MSRFRLRKDGTTLAEADRPAPAHNTQAGRVSVEATKSSTIADQGTERPRLSHCPLCGSGLTTKTLRVSRGGEGAWKWQFIHSCYSRRRSGLCRGLHPGQHKCPLIVETEGEGWKYVGPEAKRIAGSKVKDKPLPRKRGRPTKAAKAKAAKRAGATAKRAETMANRKAAAVAAALVGALEGE